GQQRGGGRARGVPSGRLPGRDGRRRRQRAAGGVRRGRRPHGLEARLRRVRADGRRRGPGTATAGPAGTGGQGDVVTGVRRGVLQLPAPRRAGCRNIQSGRAGDPDGAGTAAHGRRSGGHDRRRGPGPGPGERHGGMTDLADLATRLHEAATTRCAIPRLTDSVDLTVAQAYEVQRLLVEKRTADGEQLVGIKMGLTSQAKMAQMGVNEAIWGRLTSGMWIPDGGSMAADRFIHPRVEPEIAFRLDAHGIPTAVAPALEIIDSRYAHFKFTLPDVIADNTSAAAF